MVLINHFAAKGKGPPSSTLTSLPVKKVSTSGAKQTVHPSFTQSMGKKVETSSFAKLAPCSMQAPTTQTQSPISTQTLPAASLSTELIKRSTNHPCPKCDATLSTRQALHKHKKRKHANDLEEGNSMLVSCNDCNNFR